MQGAKLRQQSNASAPKRTLPLAKFSSHQQSDLTFHHAGNNSPIGNGPGDWHDMPNLSTSSEGFEYLYAFDMPTMPYDGTSAYMFGQHICRDVDTTGGTIAPQALVHHEPTTQSYQTDAQTQLFPLAMPVSPPHLPTPTSESSWTEDPFSDPQPSTPHHYSQKSLPDGRPSPDSVDHNYNKYRPQTRQGLSLSAGQTLTNRTSQASPKLSKPRYIEPCQPSYSPKRASDHKSHASHMSFELMNPVQKRLTSSARRTFPRRSHQHNLTPTLFQHSSSFDTEIIDVASPLNDSFPILRHPVDHCSCCRTTRAPPPSPHMSTPVIQQHTPTFNANALLVPLS